MSVRRVDGASSAEFALMARLQDKIAIVTGAANGIGEAIARRMAAEGARLALLDIDPTGLARVARELRDRGSQVLDLAGDLTDEPAVTSIFARIVQELGPPD